MTRGAQHSAFPDSKQFPRPLWITPYQNDWSLGTAAQVGVAGDVYLTACYSPFQVTLTRFDIILAVLGGAGTFLRLGIYNSVSQTAPTPDGGALLWDSGNIVADAALSKDVAFTSGSPASNITVSGWFFAALHTQDATIQFTRFGATSRFTNQGAEKLNGSRFNQAFGALPATCPATTAGTSFPFECALRYT